MLKHLTIVMAGLLASTAHGARLLQAIIDVDGRVVLRSAYQDGGWTGVPPPATVWTYLGHEPLWCETTNGLTAALRGLVTVRMEHGGRLISQASVTNLTLRSTAGKWFLPPEEVQRTARAAGLVAAPPQGSHPRPSAAGTPMREPRTTLKQALASAERYVADKKIDVSRMFLRTTDRIEDPGNPNESCWKVIWAPKDAGAPGGELRLYVYDDGHIKHEVSR
jgi:hypothetical protein